MPRRSGIASKDKVDPLPSRKTASTSSRPRVQTTSRASLPALDSVASHSHLPGYEADDSDSGSIGDVADEDPHPRTTFQILGQGKSSAVRVSSISSLVLLHGDRFFKFPPSSIGSLILLCAVFVVLTLFCLWSCAGHAVCLVSRTSFLVSLLICMFIASLSNMTHTVYQFMRVTHILLLAIFTHADSSFSRMVIFYLSTLCNAALLGYAIAEHRTRTGSDTSIDNVCSSRKKKTAPPFICLSILSVMCATRLLWITCSYAAADTAVAVVELSLTARVCFFLWACLVHVWLLYSSFFSGDCLASLSSSFVMLFCVLSRITSNLFGDAGFVVLTWLIAMAFAAFLGYTVAIYHCYNQRLQIRSTKPSQEGGVLLEGAHVDQLFKSSSDLLEGANAEHLLESDGTKRSESTQKIKDAPLAWNKVEEPPPPPRVDMIEEIEVIAEKH